jgi:hypothetical protein
MKASQGENAIRPSEHKRFQITITIEEMMKSVLLLLVFSFSVVADVFHMTEREFSEVLDGKTNLLVEFYAVSSPLSSFPPLT